MARIATNGVELEVDVRGEPDAPSVLLVHGWPDDRHLWAAQVDALVLAGYRTIAFDLRGFGESDKPDDVAAYALPELLGDVVGLLDALGVGRTHIVGHDWGAAVSWLVATAVPDRVDHLVAMSVGHLSSFAGARLEQRERSWYMLLFQFEDIAEQWLSGEDWANFRAWSRHPRPDVAIAGLARPGALTSSLGVYRANAGPARLVGPPLELPPVTAPTLGLWSTGDRHLLESQMQGSEAYVASFGYTRVDDAGHWLMLDQPQRVNELLLGFLPPPAP